VGRRWSLKEDRKDRGIRRGERRTGGGRETGRGM